MTLHPIFFVLEAKDGGFQESIIEVPSDSDYGIGMRESKVNVLFLGLLMNTFPQKHATKKTWCFSEACFLQFFPIERGLIP